MAGRLWEHRNRSGQATRASCKPTRIQETARGSGRSRALGGSQASARLANEGLIGVERWPHVVAHLRSELYLNATVHAAPGSGHYCSAAFRALRPHVRSSRYDQPTNHPEKSAPCCPSLRTPLCLSDCAANKATDQHPQKHLYDQGLIHSTFSFLSIRRKARDLGVPFRAPLGSFQAEIHHPQDSRNWTRAFSKPGSEKMAVTGLSPYGVSCNSNLLWAMRFLAKSMRLPW